MGIRSVHLEGAKDLARTLDDDFKRTDAGRTIIAFRHPSRDDPVVLFHVLARLVPRASTDQGFRPTHPISPVFLYGRGVAVWGGPFVAWILPRSGAISVYHHQLNRASLDQVFDEVERGIQPLALAPEAQVTYHNEKVAYCRRGAALMAERARDAGRNVRAYCATRPKTSV